MQIDEHAEWTSETAVYPRQLPEESDPNFVGLLYVATKLAGEAGEVSENIGKALRDDGGKITDERRNKLYKEIGDVYWYLARLCFHLGVSPSAVLDLNAEKLTSRKDRGVIQGSGDDR